MCPGGGVDFNSAITFDPAWIYGCNTGTSCNGGVVFNNQHSCEPITLLDICAPAPSLGSLITNASDVWYKFYPSIDSVTISCFQNTSLIIGIQALSGSPTCGALSQIGCALSAGPSSGVSLKLTGLTPGALYYFRIFGSAPVTAQRTGLYCFCGTTGLNHVILSTAVTGFKGVYKDNTSHLEWNCTPGANINLFEIERSTDGQLFNTVGRVYSSQSLSGAYTYSDQPLNTGMHYYRIKISKPNGNFEYSAVLPIKIDKLKAAIQVSNNGEYVQVTIKKPMTFTLYNTCGALIRSYRLLAGTHTLPTDELSSGVYMLRNSENNKADKVVVAD